MKQDTVAILRAFDGLIKAESGAIVPIPETLAVLAQFTVQPSNFYIRAMNTLILQLIADGNWNELDKFCVFATEQQQHARICWRYPTSTPLTEVNSPTWTANQGYTGNGTTSYLNTNYNHSTNSIKATRNSGSLGAYVTTNVTETSVDFGYSSTAPNNESLIASRYSGFNSAFISYNDSTHTETALGVSDSRGLTSGRRMSSTVQEIWKNGVFGATANLASTVNSNLNFFVLASNNNGVSGDFSTRRIAMYFVGSGNIDQLKIYNAFQTFATTIGFNV
jgi:hypothetical protein